MITIVIGFIVLCANLEECHAQKPELVVQTGHSDAVCSVAWSRDGRFIVSGSVDKTVRIWNGDSGREICRFSVPSCVQSVDWSPDGKLIVGGCATTVTEDDWKESEIKVWDVSTGSEVCTLQGCSKVAWSRDGRILAGGGVDSKGTEIIKLWDTSSWREIGVLTGHTCGILSIAWDPEGKIVASGALMPDGVEGEIKLWDIAAMKEIRTLHSKSSPRSLAFSPDGRIIAGRCRDSIVRLWDIKSGKALNDLQLSNGADYPLFSSVAFSQDGRYIAGGGWDICGQEGKVRLWEIDSGRIVSTLSGGSPLAFSPDGKRMLYWNKEGTLRFLDTNTMKVIPAAVIRTGKRSSVFTTVGYGIDILDISFDPDGKSMAVGSSDKSVRIWDIASGRGIRNLKPQLISAHSFSWTQDGKKLAAVGVNAAKKLEAVIWDSISGKKLHSFKYSNFDSDMNETWSPTSNLLASVYEKGVKLWDPLCGKPTGTLTFPMEDSFVSLAWKPDGKFLATGTTDKIIIWNISTLKKSAILEKHSGIISLEWRPQGDLLAGGCNDYTIKIWNVMSRKVINTIQGHSDLIRSLAWSPDGNELASASFDGTVKIWQAATGKELLTLKKLPGRFLSVDWSRDGKIVAAGCEDGTIILWDANSGSKLATLISLQGNDWIAFTPEGFFDGSPDGMTILDWRIGLKLYPIKLYFKEFYHPGLIQEIFKYKTKH